jgi:ribosomal protein L11 methyltransferase
MTDFIEARTGGLALAEPARIHVVVANLISGLLIALADELVATVRAGGRLLAGGIYKDREAEVQAAFESAGLRVIGRRTEEDWVALELEAA